MISFKTIFPVFFAVSLAACSGGETNREIPSSEPPVPVSLEKPSGNAAESGVAVSGQIEAGQTAAIGTRVMGYIDRIYVRVGDPVRAGQRLISINARDIGARRAQADAAIAQAQAALANAQKDYERFTALYARQSATAKELENTELQYKAAQAGLESARQLRNEANAQFSYTEIAAPFGGVITQKTMDAGSLASPGMPILVLESADNFRVAVTVPENEIGLLKPNAAAAVRINSTGKTLDGKVSEISQSSRSTGGQYAVRIAIPSGEKQGLYAGMYVNVSISVPKTADTTDGVVLVPRSALVTQDQLTGIYTVGQNNTALLRWLRLGRDRGNRVEVLSGLSAGESFIAHAEGRLRNGSPVKIQ